ncbi:MAG: gliding motility-associated C-terminal domain-containing protein [Bacteroidota bacterium]
MNSLFSTDDVLFVMQSSDLDLYVKADRLIYFFHTESRLPGSNWSRMDMVLENANLNTEIIAEDTCRYYEYYYSGNSGFRVGAYTKINIRNIYHQIDWVLYVKNDSLKYDFIVHPGGNPDDIKLIYNWSDSPVLQSDGSMVISNASAIITEGKPTAFQGNNNIMCSWFTGTGNKAGFDIGSYDRSEKLIIDPVIVWSTFYGAPGQENATSVYADADGVYVTGISNNNALPVYDPGAGAYFQGIYGGGDIDAYILRFTSEGERLWATYYGGSADEGNLVITGNSTSIYIAGNTGSFNLPVFDPMNGAYFQVNAGSVLEPDAFIAQFSKDGMLKWASYLGGDKEDYCKSINATDLGLLVCLQTASTDIQLFDPGGGAYFQPSPAGGRDAYFASFSSDGILEWATYFGGTGNEDGFPFGKYAGQNIVITGTTNSTNLPVTNPGSPAFFQANNQGTTDAFILKFDSNKILQWCTYFGGPGADTATAIECRDNSFYISGFTTSPAIPLFDPGIGAFFEASYSGNGDSYIGEFDLSGEQIWTSYLGGNQTDKITTLWADSLYLWIGGTTRSDNMPVTPVSSLSYYQSSNAGLEDGFIVKNQRDNRSNQWLTYFGAGGSDMLNSLCSDGSYIYFCGGSNSSGLPVLNPGAPAYFQNYNGAMDAFITRMQICFQPVMQFTASSSSLCTGDDVDITVSGADSYFWINGGYTSSSVNYTPLVSTDYGVIGYNNEGCSDTAWFHVDVNGYPVVSISGTSEICNGDTLSLTATGADQYLWQPGSYFGNPLFATPSISTDYIAYGTDVNGCTSTDTFHVDVKPSPNLSIDSPGPVCPGDTVTLTAHGAEFYLWLPGNTTDSTVTIMADSTTIVSVTGTLSNGCSSSLPFTQTVIPLPVVQFSGPSSICDGDNLNITASGASGYYWLTGGYTIPSVQYSPDSASDYGVIGYNSIGCSDTAWFHIEINDLPVITASGPADMCSGDQITLTATGGSQYTWMPGSLNDSVVNVSPAVSAEYVVQGTDTNGCSNFDTLQVVVNPLPQLTIDAPGIVCPGDTVVLAAHGAESYLWTPGGFTDSILTFIADSSFSILLTGYLSTGCFSSLPYYQPVAVVPELEIEGDTLVCPGDEAELIASGAPGLTWMPWNIQGDTLAFIVDSSTTGYVYGTTAGGCNAELPFTVVMKDPPDVNIFWDTLVCPGGSVTFFASGADSYYWPVNGSTDSVISLIIQYESDISVVGYNGCYDTTIVTVTVLPLPSLGYFPAANLCGIDSVLVTATGAETFYWITQDIVSPSAFCLTNQTYLVAGTDTNNCTDTLDIMVVSSDPFEMEIFGDTLLCMGDSAKLTTTSVDSVWWYNDSHESSITIGPDTFITVWALGFKEYCQDTGYLDIYVVENPYVFITDDTIYYNGSDIQLFASGDCGSYQWTHGDILDNDTIYNPVMISNIENPVMLFVTLTDENDCTDKDSVSILLLCPQFFIPEAFSPNGDGINDEFKIYGDCLGLVYGIQMYIYNRQGQVVFWGFDDTAPVDFSWDGTYKGMELNNDVFSYDILILTMLGAEPYESHIRGSVVLMK